MSQPLAQRGATEAVGTPSTLMLPLMKLLVYENACAPFTALSPILLAVLVTPLRIIAAGARSARGPVELPAPLELAIVIRVNASVEREGIPVLMFPPATLSRMLTRIWPIPPVPSARNPSVFDSS